MKKTVKNTARRSRRWHAGAPAWAVLLLLTVLGTAHAGLHNGWVRRSSIRFQGYDRDAPLTNFPVLVLLSTNIPGFAYSQFASPATGADLRFANSNDTVELPHDIEAWDTNGVSAVWVRVPLLQGTGDAIRAYWGKTSAGPASTPATWDSDHLAVWHLSATNGYQPDATSNGNLSALYSGQADLTAPGLACESDVAVGSKDIPINGNLVDQLYGAGTYWQVDLGPGTTRTARLLRLLNSGGTWATKDFRIKGSTNGTDWVELHSNRSSYATTWQIFPFWNETAYRFYRLDLLSHWGSGHDIMELELLERVPREPVAGIIGGAEDFDGSDDEMSVTRALPLPRTNLTISFWVTNQTYTDDDVAFLGTTANWVGGFGFYYCLANTIRFWITAWGVNLVDGIFTPSEWTHMAGTYDGSMIRLYINGKQAGTDTYSGEVSDPNRLETLGRQHDTTLNLDGRLDEVRFESTARSSNWIWACWFSQASNSAFTSYGTVELNPTANVGAFLMVN